MPACFKRFSCPSIFFRAQELHPLRVFAIANGKCTSLSEVSGTSNHYGFNFFIVFHCCYSFRLCRNSPGCIESKPWTHKNARKGPTERTHQCLEEWNSRNAGVKKDYPPILASLAIGLAGASCELRNEIKTEEVSLVFPAGIFQPEEKVSSGEGRMEGAGDGGEIDDSEIWNKKAKAHTQL